MSGRFLMGEGPVLQEEGTSWTEALRLSKSTSHKEHKKEITWKRLEKWKGWLWYAGSRPGLYSFSKHFILMKDMDSHWAHAF